MAFITDGTHTGISASASEQFCRIPEGFLRILAMQDLAIIILLRGIEAERTARLNTFVKGYLPSAPVTVGFICF